MSQKTPNVPKSRDSFFHRKYRDISNCPPTPATPKVTANQYHHFRSATASSKLINTTPTTSSATSANRRSNKKLKRDQNESITSDYSTPRTIRTPTTGRLRGKQRVTHLIYRPLELDTESSSESSDNNFRRRKLAATTPNSLQTTTTKPLAIEGPSNKSLPPTPIAHIAEDSLKSSSDDDNKNDNGSPMVKGSGAVAKSTTTTPINGSSDITHNDEDTIVEPQLVKATHENSAEEDEVQVIGFKPAPSATIKTTPEKVVPAKNMTSETKLTSNKNKDASSAMANVGSESLMSSSEPPTPPITPEKVKEETSTFVPGNIWIFNATQERSSVLSTQTT